MSMPLYNATFSKRERHMRQDDGSLDECIEVITPNCLEPLPLSDDVLRNMVANICANSQIYVPGFRYWEMDDMRRMSQPDNLCGYQQRAWDFYWSIHTCVLQGRLALGIGTSNCASPGCLATDKYYGTHPTYGSYLYPHMALDADSIPYPFFDAKFGAVIANHSIEHLGDPAACLREWWRLLMPDGYICIITPDMAYNLRGKIDSTHICEFSSHEFFRMVESLELPNAQWVAFNTLNNDFSFDAVLRKA